MDKSRRRERLIEWTGERCVPWADDLQVIYEHYHRYAFALRFTEGKRVLDLASGEGFGCAMLAAKAAWVVGVDIDERTVEHARRRYGADPSKLDNLRFETASITDPYALADEPPFDVITCFEAIEHVTEQADLMRLVRNKLAPGGVFLCSTPDVDVYTHEHGNENPYHVQELSEPAFRELLSASFEHVRLVRQNVAVGSLIHGAGSGDGGDSGVGDGDVADSGGGETFSLTQRDDGWDVDPGAPHTYLLGIASARPVEVPATSVLVDPELTLVARQAALGGEREAALAGARQAEREAVEERDAAIQDRDAAQRRHDAAAKERDDAVERAEAVGQHYRQALQEADGMREKSRRDAARLSWLSDNLNELRRTVHALSTENATLRAEQNALAQKLVGKYRNTVEKWAPRGTRRRDAYEAVLGRHAPADDPGVPGPVAITSSREPLVSVVIPTYGNWAYTRRCLESIEVHAPITPFEVIVVDDGSVDDSAERVAQCPGVRLVRAERNLGFVGACNLGAAHARGELLMFLNNDTEVRSGWLDALVDVFDTVPGVGLAGSKLIYPDGTLQECGGIVWADGTGWNYGRNSSPDESRYRTMRDVDYCSGAALMVRQNLFDQLGGFDSRYAPAYYEDTDLAFAVRAAGYRTIVQPESVVVHHEGVSNGTDTTSGIKRQQVLNQAVFAEKWADALEAHLPEASPRNVWLGSARPTSGPGGHQTGLVLVADHQVPRTDEDSGSVRMSRLLDLLVDLGQRVVFFPMNGATPDKYTRPMHRRGVTVIGDAGGQAEFLKEAGSALRLAVLSRPQVAWQLLEPVREHAPDCVVAYDTVDLHFLRLRRQAEVAGELGDVTEAKTLLRRADVLAELELGLVRACDRTLTVSDVEQKLLGELVPSAQVDVLSNVHDPSADVAVRGDRSGVLFVGSFDHIPNRDAARWLVEGIMPLVRKQHPDTVAHIVGSNPPPEVLALGDEDDVVVHGWVDDLAERYRKARVVVAPLRFGAGVKGKVGEALAHGVPVVGTTIALEGMHLTDGEDALLADTDGEFAERIVSLLDDDALWRTLSDAGKEAVSRRFGKGVARDTLAGLLRPGGSP